VPLIRTRTAPAAVADKREGEDASVDLESNSPEAFTPNTVFGDEVRVGVGVGVGVSVGVDVGVGVGVSVGVGVDVGDQFFMPLLLFSP